MKTILLADDNRIWLDLLEEGILREGGYEVVGKAYDGKETIEMVEQYRPDILILDIIMPEVDGVYIVNYIRQSLADYQPLIYILSGIATDTVIKILSDLDIDFYSMKPVTLEHVIENIKKIEQHRHTEPLDGLAQLHRSQSASTKTPIKNLVYSLGMPPHWFATKCVVEAIFYYTYEQESNVQLTKTLYPKIARELNISISSVEKNIRTAVAQMQSAKTERYNEIFLYANDANKNKISNGAFLSIMRDYLKA